jgi:hypothetical protein
MVLDAPEVAAKIARHASARSSQLLMVDSMRYDLGVLVKEALVASLGTKAALSHEMILWSAMPTTSVRQLTTLSRGVAALQAPGDEDRDEGGMRGRTAHTIRRLKIGSRDVYKLDVCDVRLRESGEPVADSSRARRVFDWPLWRLDLLLDRGQHRRGARAGGGFRRGVSAIARRRSGA